MVERPGSWVVVFGAALGVGMGVSALLTYNAGLFAFELGQSIGLSRTVFGVSFFLTTLVMSITLPLIGLAVDRWGARIIATSGAALLSLAFVALGVLTTNVGNYLLLMLLLGVLGAASTPVSYTRAVSASFQQRRGLALGLTQVGIGVSALIVPPLVGWTISTRGWRFGYYVLAAIALCGAFPAYLGLRGSPVANPRAHIREVDFGNLLSDRLFWRQMIAFAIMALGFVGITTHFAPMLRDVGLSAAKTGQVVGLVGLSTLISRVVVGRLLDKTHPPRVAAAACLICASGCSLLMVAHTRAVAVAAITLGCAMGAETDLVAFLTARYWGVALYGRAYACQFAAFILAAGLSGIWVGMIADATGGYDRALLIATVLLLIASGLFWLLPRAPTYAVGDS